jgi:RNA polymerase sigma factor (sigma-70 family)
LTSLNDIPPDELSRIGNMVYNLAIGMLHNPEEAEDVTQDIIIKVHAKIGQFRGDSALSTWVYKLARNHLLDHKQNAFRQPLTFEIFAQDVTSFTPYNGELGLTRHEEQIYAEEIKVGCTTAMLQCLSPVDRFVFILGSLFGFDGKTAADICGLSGDTYRQKLSRGRQKMGNFMKKNCGLLNDEAPCQCRRRIMVAVERGRINPERLMNRTDDRKIRDTLKEMNEIDEVARIFQDNPWIDKRALFESLAKNRFGLLSDAAGSADQ